MAWGRQCLLARIKGKKSNNFSPYTPLFSEKHKWRAKQSRLSCHYIIIIILRFEESYRTSFQWFSCYRKKEHSYKRTNVIDNISRQFSRCSWKLGPHVFLDSWLRICDHFNTSNSMVKSSMWEDKDKMEQLVLQTQKSVWKFEWTILIWILLLLLLLPFGFGALMGFMYYFPNLPLLDSNSSSLFLTRSHVLQCSSIPPCITIVQIVEVRVRGL